jgi:hypothetical protein
MITNIHVHTPYSFSAFRSISELVETAAAEAVTVLGINDLNTVDGFKEFSNCCKKSGLFPVFNIELNIENDVITTHPHQDDDTTSFFTGKLSGKALPYPLPLSGDVHNLIASIWKGSQDRIWKMIDRLNNHLEERKIPVKLEYNTIRSNYAKTSVYEQHIALALYKAIIDYGQNNAATVALLRSLFTDDDYSVAPEMSAEIQQNILNRLLVFGKCAYVSTLGDTALTMAQARHLILQTGGIPCYQCKLGSDDCGSKGCEDPSSLAKKLISRGIFAIEFIPQWTTMTHLRKFMTYFHKESFCVSIGTGHFSNLSKSIIPVTKEGVRLDDDLLDISYKGACILASHQKQRIHKQPGFLDESGNRIVLPGKLPQFIEDGHQEILKAVHH